MFRPSIEEVRGYEDTYGKVPLIKTIYTDLYTPISVLCKMQQRSKRYFLLESMEGDHKVCRYSFVGYNPKEVITSEDGENPFEKLRRQLPQIAMPKIQDLPPFYGGAVGYFGYETVKYVKPIQLNNPKDLQTPEMLMMVFDDMIVFDHQKQTLSLIAMMDLQCEEVEVVYEKAKKRITNLQELLDEPMQKPRMCAEGPICFKEMETRESFEEKVQKIKGYIKQGDVFQTVLSTKFYFETEDDLLGIYRALRVINPSPYMYFMACDDVQIVGASPETLVKVNERQITTMPIAGTKKRGKTTEEDDALAEVLRGDEKENAEHTMLVDLARNDVGAVSAFGTVKVTKYKEIQKFSHVMHMTSEVEGTLRESYDSIHALQMILPAGTLSGAPKIRAMEIIGELEEKGRGVYGGGIGYIGYDGTLDTCIAIRTIVKQGNVGVLQAGAGIVLDSLPEKEYEEVVNKLGALSTAIQKVGDGV
ncbi:MAG: anthranilate synthase component I [Cellulosilyticaceae bacterium]